MKQYRQQVMQAIDSLAYSDFLGIRTGKTLILLKFPGSTLEKEEVEECDEYTSTIWLANGVYAMAIWTAEEPVLPNPAYVRKEEKGDK